MFKYAVMFIGLIVMCVPEDAGMLRFALQAFTGLGIFSLGVFMSLNEQTAQ